MLTRELLVAELQTGLATDVCRFRHWSLLPRSSPLVTINSLPEELQVASVEDGQNLLSRYRGASRLLQDEIEALRVGLADGLVANAHSVGLVIEMLDRQLAEPVEDWPLWLPLETDHPDWDPQLDAAWRAELDAVVRAEIGPALATYRDFLRAEVLPVARPADQTGLSALPQRDHSTGAVPRGCTRRWRGEVAEMGCGGIIGSSRRRRRRRSSSI